MGCNYIVLCQLVWEKNASAGKAWNYTYDNGGNILSRTEYACSGNGTVSGSGTTTSYTYGDAEWGDLLTAYNGEEITYDGIGNPLSYRGWTMSWQGGRRLAGMTKGSDTLSFAYNESGLRTSKTVNGVAHSYVWQGSKLAADITDAYALYFHYDSTGDVIGFTRTASGADAEYFYVKNLQGDILKVITATGTEAATYTYDAWGKLLTSSGDLADINPLRYRGYFYDTETGLYYLQSRYYDPEVGRWINIDNVEYLGTEDELISYNLFTYCLNNPVNRTDENGNLSLPNWAKVAIGAVALAGAVALTVATGGGAAAVAVGVAKVVGSVALSTAVSAGVGYLQNGKQGAIDGACNGFMFGSLSALGGAAFKYVKVRSATTGSPNSMGQAGERMAGIDQSAKQSIQVNGRTRIPDALTETTLTEVKNVKYISNTQQLRDFATYANATGRSLELWVRPTTRVARTVVDAGWHINTLW